MKPKVTAIFIAPDKGAPMQQIESAEAVPGRGLKGDRYAEGKGRWGDIGERQVTFINSFFFPGTGFAYADSRRNIITEGIELMRLIGKPFRIGNVEFVGVKYCYPCNLPKSSLPGAHDAFNKAFHDRAGLIAAVVGPGTFAMCDDILVPYKTEAGQR